MGDKERKRDKEKDLEAITNDFIFVPDEHSTTELHPQSSLSHFRYSLN